jgi:hypothetical protein
MEGELDLPHDLNELSPVDLRDLFVEERKRCVVLEKDLSKKIAELRKAEA